MKSQRLAQDHQRARVELFECAAQRAVLARRHAVAQPALGAQQGHPLLAGLAVVALVDVLLRHPVGQALAQLAVNVVKKGQRQVGGGRSHAEQSLCVAGVAQSPWNTGFCLAENAL
jgi:hypothetical protein